MASSDSTQYLIDIAAQIRGADNAAAQLSALASSLQSAGEAAQAAADDLADREQLYAQMEKAALTAAKAVEKAALKGPVPDDLKQKADQAAAALRGEAVAIDELRQKSTAAASAYAKLQDQFKKQSALAESSRAAARGTGNIKKLAGALNDLGGGPLTRAGSGMIQFVDGLQDFSEVLGTAGGPIGIVIALSVALIGLAVAAGVGLVAMTRWALGMADARREGELFVEAVEADNEALGLLSESLPRLTRMTGLTANELADLGKQLQSAKVSAEDMPAALEAIGKVKFAGGDTSKWIKELKEGKKTVAQLSQEVNKKFGGIVARKMLGLAQQSKTLQKNLGETFGGLEIEPFLRALQQLVALFDQNTAMGRALKFVFEGLFQPLVDGATKGIQILRAFLVGMAIGALQLYIAFKPAIRAVQELFGKDPGSSLKSTLDLAVAAGKSLAAAIAAVVTVMVIVGAVIASAFLPAILVVAAARAGFQLLAGAVSGAIEKIRGMSLAEIGTAMIAGLVAGITGGAGKVVAALGGVVKAAITSAKNALGIASPSKVFEGLGDMTAAGFSQGVEGGEGAVQSAMQSMVAAPAAVSAPAGERAASGASVRIGNLTIQLPGVTDAQAFARELPGALTRLLEGDAAAAGA